MLMQTDTAGTARTLAQIWQADAAGMARKLQQLWQADAAGNPRLVFSSNSALTVSPSEADAYISSTEPARAFTNNVTVSGYSGSPSIVWTVPSGWIVTAQGNPTTAFKSPPVNPNDNISGTGTVTIGSQSATFTLSAYNQGNG